MRELEAVIINDPDNEDHIQEEIADVLNLLEQIMIYKHWCLAICLVKEYKINRQMKRMAQEQEVQQ